MKAGVIGAGRIGKVHMQSAQAARILIPLCGTGIPVHLYQKCRHLQKLY